MTTTRLMVDQKKRKKKEELRRTEVKWCGFKSSICFHLIVIVIVIMSFLSNPFSTKRAKPRKHISRGPLKLSADEMYRELGPKCEMIDIRVADRKISYDIDQGEWNTAGAESLAGAVPKNTVQKIRKDVEVLQEENNMLKLKVEILLNLVAESIAEMPAAQK